jgi:hypothetical protein
MDAFLFCLPEWRFAVSLYFPIPQENIACFLEDQIQPDSQVKDGCSTFDVFKLLIIWN